MEEAPPHASRAVNESATGERGVSFPNGARVIGDRYRGVHRLCGVELATPGFVCVVADATPIAQIIHASRLDRDLAMTPHDLLDLLPEPPSFGPERTSISPQLHQAARNAGVTPSALVAQLIQKAIVRRTSTEDET